MQEELEIMRPLLEEAAKDTMLTMDQIRVRDLSLLCDWDLERLENLLQATTD